MDALFLRHEGFLGAMGAFLKVHPITPPAHLLQRKSSKKVNLNAVQRGTKFDIEYSCFGVQELSVSISDLILSQMCRPHVAVGICRQSLSVPHADYILLGLCNAVWYGSVMKGKGYC